MIYIIESIEMHKDVYIYAAMSAFGIYITVKFNLLLRQSGIKKNILLFLIILCSVLIMYWYFLEKYSVSISLKDWGVLYLFMPFASFVYEEYVFRISTLERLEKKYKKFDLKDIKKFISKDRES